MAVLYKYSYLQNHPNCANLLLFKKCVDSPISAHPNIDS